MTVRNLQAHLLLRNKRVAPPSFSSIYYYSFFIAKTITQGNHFGITVPIDTDAYEKSYKGLYLGLKNKDAERETSDIKIKLGKVAGNQSKSN